MVFLLSLLLACRDDPEVEPHPFEWTDTAVASAWDSPLVFDGPVPSNILMISVDTLRRDALGTYGSATETAFFDRLLSEGVRLDNHMQCSSWTFASTTCTLAGRYHEDLGYMPRLTQEQSEVPAGTPFLASWLAEAGFYTQLTSTNSWLSRRWGNAQGYDVFLDEGGTALTLGRAAYDKLVAEAPERWFMHVHVTEPHAPYNPPERYLDALDDLEPIDFDLSDKDVHYGVNGNDKYERLPPATQDLVKQHLQARYAGDVAWLDDQLADWFAELDAVGALDDTLVVLWSDHGEAFFEHGHQTHAWLLQPEENDGIAVFWAKNLAPVAWSGPTSAVDLVPTLLEVYGLPLPEEVTGVPLGSALPSRTRFASVDARAGVIQSVRRDDYVLHYLWKAGRLELYDRAIDPQATEDIYDVGHPVVRELWPILQQRSRALQVLVPEVPRAPPI